MSSTVNVEHHVQIIVSLDDDQNVVQLRRSGTLNIKCTRELEVAVVDTREVPPTTVDQSLNFGLVGTGKWLYMECDREIAIKINGSTTAMKVSRDGVAGTAKLMWDGEFTSISVSNSDDTNGAILTYAIVGEP